MPIDPLKPLLTVLYDGAEILTIKADGHPVVHSAGVNRARINAGLLDTDSSHLLGELTRLNQVATAGLCNPYRDALGKLDDVCGTIPREKRAGMRRHDVQAVLDAVVLVAARAVH